MQPSKNKIYKRDFIYLAVLVMMSFLLFYNTAYIQHLGMDLMGQSYAMFATNARVWNTGEIPLWRPELWNGFPAVGHVLGQVFYPVNILLGQIFYDTQAEMMSFSMLTAYFMFHIAVLAVSTYFLIRVSGKSPEISFFSSTIAIFTVCGLQGFYWAVWHSGIVYIPTLLAFGILLFRAKTNNQKIIYMILAGFTLGWIGLANPSVSLLQAILYYAMLVFVLMWYCRAESKELWKNFFFAFGSGIIALAVCLVTLEPFIFFYKDAYRYLPSGTMTIEAFTEHAVSSKDIRDLFSNFYPYKNLGMGLLGVLTVFGSFFIKKPQNKAIFSFAKIMMVFTILYCIAFLIPDILYYIPFINGIREPILYITFLAIAAALLISEYTTAICGLIFKRETIANLFYHKGLFMIVSLILCGIALLPHMFHVANIFVLICVVVVVLAIKFSKILKKKRAYLLAGIGLGCIITTYAPLYFQMNKMNYTNAQACQSTFTGNHAMDEIFAWIDAQVGNKTDYRIVGWQASEPAYFPNMNIVMGKRDLLGYVNPIQQKVMDIHNTISISQRCAIQNVPYILLNTEEDEKYFEYVEGMGFEKAYVFENILSDYNTQNAPKVSIIAYKAPQWAGEAWFTKTVLPYNDSTSIEEIAEIMDQQDYNAIETTLVNIENRDLPVIEGKGGEVVCVERKNNSVTYETTTKTTELLVTAENNYPGWKVYIDSKPAELLEVNYNFRGVVVPEGTHTITFVYQPVDVYLFAILSVITIIGGIGTVCVLIVLEKNKKKK